MIFGLRLPNLLIPIVALEISLFGFMKIDRMSPLHVPLNTGFPVWSYFGWTDDVDEYHWFSLFRQPTNRQSIHEDDAMRTMERLACMRFTNFF